MSRDTTALDYPIWHALSTAHAHLALGDDLAKRYPNDLGPLSAIKDQSPEAYGSLAQLLGPEERAILFLTDLPSPPEGWRIIRCFPMQQMVCDIPPTDDHKNFEIRTLTVEDVPEMQRLAEATEPGPFRNRTIELGGYRGIHDDGRLVSMTGQRLGLTEFTEVSAVCTYPEFRGRGYAGALVREVAQGIYKQDKTPFLGVKQDNVNAIRVYEKAGFKIRRMLHVVFLKRPR